MKRFATLLCCVLLHGLWSGLHAASKERPSWTDGYFADCRNSYIEVASAEGRSESDARENAIRIILVRRSITTGQYVNVHVTNGNITVEGDDALTVKARIVDEYRETTPKNLYRVYILVQMAKNPELQYEPVAVTSHYKFSPRVFVPGMAQIHKGQNVRGALFIVGEAAMIGGIAAFEGLRTSYRSKMQTTHDVKALQAYKTKADNMQNIRNGFIAGAAAVYVWNIIDGAVAKGKKHVVVGDARLNWVPYADNMSAGVMLNLKF